MMKKSFEIWLEKAKKKKKKKAKIDYLMKEKPQEYLEQLYQERRDLYDKLDKIKK